MSKMHRLWEAEDIIAEMDMSEVDDDIAETDEDTQIIISGWYIHLPELGLKLHEGTVGIRDEEMQGYMPDFSVTVVHEADSDNTDYICYGRDGFVITMANWLNGRLSIDEIEQLECEIVIPHESNRQDVFSINMF